MLAAAETLQNFSAVGSRNFFVLAPVQLNGKIKDRRSHHVHFPPVVHPVRNVLAAGSAGAYRLSVRLVAAVALPDRGRCGPRSARDYLSSDHTAVPVASCAVQDLGRS